MQMTVPRGRTYCGWLSQHVVVKEDTRECERSVYLCGLLEWLLVDGDEDDGVWTQAIRGSSLHILDDILALHEINKVPSTKLVKTHVLLLISSINTNDTKTHGLCVLASQRAQPSAGADNGDGLARACARLLETLVDGDAGAENGGDGGEVAFLWNAGGVGALDDAVLLEGAVDGVAGEEGAGAEGLVGGLAEVAGEAGAVDPLCIEWSVEEGGGWGGMRGKKDGP